MKNIALNADFSERCVVDSLALPSEFVNDDETPWDVNLMSVAATFC
jgi:hypothetical protein